MISATQKGLSLEGISRLDLGQIIDYAIEYNNEIHEYKEGKTVEASQTDWDAFLA